MCGSSTGGISGWYLQLSKKNNNFSKVQIVQSIFHLDWNESLQSPSLQSIVYAVCLSETIMEPKVIRYARVDLSLILMGKIPSIPHLEQKASIDLVMPVIDWEDGVIVLRCCCYQWSHGCMVPYLVLPEPGFRLMERKWLVITVSLTCSNRSKKQQLAACCCTKACQTGSHCTGGTWQITLFLGFHCAVNYYYETHSMQLKNQFVYYNLAVTYYSVKK